MGNRELVVLLGCWSVARVSTLWIDGTFLDTGRTERCD